MRKSIAMSLRKLFVVTAAVAALGVAAGAAVAQTAQQKALIDAAKDRGIVGEQANGELAFRTPSSDASLTAAVTVTNNARRALYAQTAAELRISPQVAGARAFETIIKISSGHWVRNARGEWEQR